MEAIVGIVVLAVVILGQAVKILREYERAVVFRLGRLQRPAKGPGLIVIIPIVDRMLKVDLRVVTMDVPKQEVITRDNVPVSVNAVVYFRVMNPENSVVEVENYITATAQISQTPLRSVVGQAELDELLSEREQINNRLQEIIDEHTDPWGIKVTLVEIKQVDLPQDMQRALARQAEAEREKRAKIIHAEGELQASEKLHEVSKILAQEPVAVQLRYFQTLTELGTEKNSTIVFPIPMDIFSYFTKDKSQK